MQFWSCSSIPWTSLSVEWAYNCMSSAYMWCRNWCDWRNRCSCLSLLVAVKTVCCSVIKIHKCHNLTIFSRYSSNNVVTGWDVATSATTFTHQVPWIAGICTSHWMKSHCASLAKSQTAHRCRLLPGSGQYCPWSPSLVHPTASSICYSWSLSSVVARRLLLLITDAAVASGYFLRLLSLVAVRRQSFLTTCSCLVLASTFKMNNITWKPDHMLKWCQCSIQFSYIPRSSTHQSWWAYWNKCTGHSKEAFLD